MSPKTRSASTLVARFLQRTSLNTEPGTSIPNPFLPQKNATAGRWHPPQYSLRRQKELVKQARTDGVLGVLPAGLKAGREQGAGSPTVETSIGLVPRWEGEPPPRSTAGIRSTQRRFKGHKWEKEQKERAEFVAKRMEGMAERIAEMKLARIQERTKSRPSLPF